MTMPMVYVTKLQEAFAALKRDLINEDGPRISTMLNYRFAILQYEPDQEFKLRAEVQRLSGELIANGWVVFSIDLQKLLLDRIRAMGPEWQASVVRWEHASSSRGIEPTITYLKSKISPLIEGDGGLAADCGRIIHEYTERHADQRERMLALIGRAGALYPFFRSSALLKHLDGKTDGVPVVLLYPGKRSGPTSLSFMGELEPDADYRPRIYSGGLYQVGG